MTNLVERLQDSATKRRSEADTFATWADDNASQPGAATAYANARIVAGIALSLDEAADEITRLTAALGEREGWVLVRRADLQRIADQNFNCSSHQHGMAASGLAERMLAIPAPEVTR